MADAKFVPIVEPVKEVLNGLMRSIEAVCKAGGEMVLIVNPANGDHIGRSESLNKLVGEELKDHTNISPGFLLTSETSLKEVSEVSALYSDRLLTLIHCGFSNGKALADQIEQSNCKVRNVFIEGKCARLYRKHFPGPNRVLIHDGFERRANREHPEIEQFSDLHATFTDLGMDGFGDFLIVGDEYSDTGGPAYAVAIHITCIDDENDDLMLVHHFKSIRYDTPTDPAGKFAEALQKLVNEVNREGTKILRTSAIEEFFELHKNGHFPGLGYVKKLSMNHHIETLAAYFRRA